MTRCAILFGNDPQAYRQALAATVGVVRQDVESIVIAPEQLDQEVRRRHVCFVVCSRLTEGVKVTAVDWAVLYPDGDQHVEINHGGVSTCHVKFELKDLLAAIDEAVARAGHDNESCAET